jgi:putative tricarboxylic transport membrane protein
MSLEAAFAAVFSPLTFAFLLVGLLIGIAFGSVPGIGGVIAMAIILPLTVKVQGIPAVVMLVSIYLGSLYGGAISAILLNVPGTSAAVASTFDGTPLAKQGKALYALALSAIASSIGGLLASLLLLVLTPYLVLIVLQVDTPEYFLIAVLGLAVLPLVLPEGSQLKGFFAAAFGLLMTTIGIAQGSAVVRYTFDIPALYDGISYVAVLVGLYAISEMISLINLERETVAESAAGLGSNTRATIDAFGFIIRHPISTVKFMLIGAAVGAIPGTGASISNIVAYAEAVRSSDNPESFGKGNELGLVASETANNATTAGSLVPVLTFGIPGGAASAVILGGMILHGIVPGPQLFTTNIQITQTIFASVAVGSILVLIIGLLGAVQLGRITQVDKDYIIPFVIVFAISGAYTLNVSVIDVLTVFVAGVIGYLFRKYDYPVVALLLGVILGPIIETNLLRSLSLSGGSYTIFIQDPLSIIILSAIIFVVIGPSITSVVRLLSNRGTI